MEIERDNPAVSRFGLFELLMNYAVGMDKIFLYWNYSSYFISVFLGVVNFLFNF